MDRSVDQANLEAQPATLVAVASVIVSMALAAVGNGLMFAYIPVRLGLSGYEKMYFCGGVGGKLVAVMSNVVSLCVMCDVIASGSVEGVLKGVE